MPRPGSNVSGGPSINKLQKLADKEQDDIADITEDEDDDNDQFGEPVTVTEQDPEPLSFVHQQS